MPGGGIIGGVFMSGRGPPGGPIGGINPGGPPGGICNMNSNFQIMNNN